MSSTAVAAAASDKQATTQTAAAAADDDECVVFPMYFTLTLPPIVVRALDSIKGFGPGQVKYDPMNDSDYFLFREKQNDYNLNVVTFIIIFITLSIIHRSSRCQSMKFACRATH